MRKIKRLLYAWVDKKFLGGCSSYNSLATRKSCRSKEQARDAFAKNGIPHAKGKIFFGPFAAFRFVQKHGFPVVVKPNVSGFSRGSYFPITNYRELLKACIKVKKWWPRSVIEQYLLGNNYRIVVVKDEIMSVIQRYPPFVIGDGVSSISKLIDRENEIRKQMGLFPVMYPIKKSRRVTKHLKKDGNSYSTIPAENQMITLFNRVALAPGGIVETLDKEKMHPHNRDLFLRILPLFNANILGIDAIFEKGMEISHREQKTIFLEVNSRPYLKMHDHPRYGEKQDLDSYYSVLNNLEVQEKDIF